MSPEKGKKIPVGVTTVQYPLVLRSKAPGLHETALI